MIGINPYQFCAPFNPSTSSGRTGLRDAGRRGNALNSIPFVLSLSKERAAHHKTEYKRMFE